MTNQQAAAEMKYRLSKYILQVLLDDGQITEEDALRAKSTLLERYLCVYLNSNAKISTDPAITANRNSA